MSDWTRTLSRPAPQGAAISRSPAKQSATGKSQLKQIESDFPVAKMPSSATWRPPLLEVRAQSSVPRVSWSC
jgi:hypothetical protein